MVWTSSEAAAEAEAAKAVVKIQECNWHRAPGYG